MAKPLFLCQKIHKKYLDIGKNRSIIVSSLTIRLGGMNMLEKRAELDELLKQLISLSKKHIHLKEDGVTIYPGQPALFRTIIENEGISQKELASLCYKKPATITTMLQKMEKQGLITRVQDEKDKRKIHLYITEKGRQFDANCEKTMNEFIQKSLEGITQEEVDTILNVLNKIKKNLER